MYNLKTVVHYKEGLQEVCVKTEIIMDDEVLRTFSGTDSAISASGYIAAFYDLFGTSEIYHESVSEIES
jgi:hypothetical protein